MAPTKRIRVWRVIVWAVMGLALGAVSGRWIVAVFAAIVFGAARFIGELSRPKPVTHVLPPLSPKLAAHYATTGLDDEEIALFRETMDQTAEQIRTISDLVTQNNKLKALNMNTDIVDILHAYFQALVSAPHRLNAAGDFVYKQVPRMESLMQRYLQISHHEVKTADTYATLDKAFQTMTALSESIKNDYQAFIKDDLEALDGDVRLAQKQIHEPVNHEME